MTLNLERGPAVSDGNPSVDGYGLAGRLTGRDCAITASAVLSVLVIVLEALVGAGVADWIPIGFRAFLIAVSAFALPGIAAAAMLSLPGYGLNVAVAAPLSLAIVILSGQTQIVLGWFHPIATHLVIATVSLGLSLIAYVYPRGASGKPLRLASVSVWRARAPWLGVLLIALVLFFIAAKTLDLTSLSDTGVILHVGPYYVVALALLAVVSAWVFTRRRFDVTLGFITVAVVVVVTSMLTAVATRSASFPTAYIHRGFIEILSQLHHLPPPADARFSWAGFFSGSAQLVAAAGLPNADAFLQWAPVVNEFVIAGPLFVIGIMLTRNRRIAVTGLLLYSLFNWYQQDYFSPQSIATLMYTSIMALLLWQLRRRHLPTALSPRLAASATAWREWWRHSGFPGNVRSLSAARHALAQRPPVPPVSSVVWSVLAMVRRTPGRVHGRGARWELTVEALLVIIMAAMVVDHQLTPIVAIGALFTFSALGLTRYRLLWVVALGMFVAWFSFGATVYWTGHLKYIFGSVGQVQSSVSGGVSQRIGVAAPYKFLQYNRLAASGTFAIAGILGWLFLVRRDRLWIPAGSLWMIPFSLVAVQSYGGEVVIRSFVLASPVLAPTAALLITRIYVSLSSRRLSGLDMVWYSRMRPVKGRGPRLVLDVLAMFVGFAVMVSLVANRGLNTGFEYTSREQDRVTTKLMDSVPAGTTIMTWGSTATLASGRLFTEVEVTRVDSLECLSHVAQCTLERRPAYVVTGPQAETMLKTEYKFQAKYIGEQIAKLLSTGDYVMMVQRPDITIIRSVDAPSLNLG